MIHPRPFLRCAAVWCALVGFAATAHSATWVGGRATPTVREIVAVDGTGEANWPYGAEDVAGDGVGSFPQPEQSIDIRTAYAATDQQRLWARVYVSGAQPVGGNVHAFVFIDSDRNPATGGSGVAPEINASFTGDPSPGGYEHVVEVMGNGSGLQLWTWQVNQYTQGQLPPPRASGEGGTDTDPIRIGAPAHGYAQVSIDLDVVSLTQACDANLYFRTTNDSAALGAGDLDVGQAGSCVPGLNGNGIPNVVVPPNGCTTNAGCPAGAECQGGQCALAQACTTNADCAGGAQCMGGRCSGGSGTGAGGESALVLAPGEEIKGGACNCALPGRSTPAGAPGFCIAAIALLVTRRRSVHGR